MIVVKLFMFLCLYERSVSADKDQVVSNVEIDEKFYDLNKANELFEGFLKSYNKEYRNRKEYNYRFKVFVETLKNINKLNKGSDGEEYGITKFADITHNEFVQEYTGLRTDDLFNNTSPFASKPQLNVPENWEWRSKGLVTPARDQMNCGSCWAFSTVACVEGQYAKKHGSLLSLSEQQLVDCYKKSCFGDYPDRALQFAAKNMGGFMLAQDYPYKGVAGECQFEKAKVNVKVRGGVVILVASEEELKELVYNYGPVSIGITTGSGFMSYKKGIATAKKLGCTPQMDINHAVVIVGYGTENGTPYWIIKNSFGSQWGEQGFLRIERGTNACNILKYVATADVQ